MELHSVSRETLLTQNSGDIISKVKTRPGMGWFQMFLLTGRFVSWETAKVLNYALFEETISRLGDFSPLFIYATGHNK